MFPEVAVTSAPPGSSRQYANTRAPTSYSTANFAVMLPADAVHAVGLVEVIVTVLVPDRETVTAFPPVVYPFAFATSFVTPA